MDEGVVSKQVMQKNSIIFFFLNTKCEMNSWQAFDYTN